jgi:hypothetical protein
MFGCIPQRTVSTLLIFIEPPKNQMCASAERMQTQISCSRLGNFGSFAQIALFLLLPACNLRKVGAQKARTSHLLIELCHVF